MRLGQGASARQSALHEPWVARVTGQLLAACDELESELARKPLPASRADMRQAGISIAVVWHFKQQMVPELVPAQRFPRLAAFSAAAETLPEFKAAPHGDATYHDNG